MDSKWKGDARTPFPWSVHVSLCTDSVVELGFDPGLEGSLKN